MLLPPPIRYDAPFAYLRFNQALAPHLQALRAAFDAPRDWQRHQGTFYEAWMSPTPPPLPKEDLRQMSQSLSSALDLPLTEDVTLTLQRMDPGDGARPHTDRPLVGYEAARLIVQLTEDWAPTDGGWFEVHPDEQGTDTLRRHEPHFGSAIAFAMTPRSFHSVTPSRAPRYTAVFHFHHRANPRRLRRDLTDLYTGLRFDGLPTALDRTMAEAEAHHGEELTFQAGVLAWTHLQLGGPTPEAIELYEGHVSGADCPTGALPRLSWWLTQLHLGIFDAAAWRRWAKGRHPLPAGLPQEVYTLEQRLYGCE